MVLRTDYVRGPLFVRSPPPGWGVRGALVSALNYGCTQTFFYKIESNLHYTRFITLPVVPKRGNEWRGPTPQLIAPWQRSFEETLQRWRAVGQSGSDSTGLGIELQIFRIDSDIFITTL